MTPIDYNNPNDMWRNNGYDPYKGMSDKERMKAGCFQLVVFFVMIMVGLAMCALFGSCSTTEYIPLPQQHTEHHWHTDSVMQRDSVHTENTTIIREVDSAAMAKYGIQMQNNQRAWLVLQREMEQRLRELEHMTAQRDTVHDSIPYPVIREVKAELSAWQKLKVNAASGILAIFMLFVLFWCIRKK